MAASDQMIGAAVDFALVSPVEVAAQLPVGTVALQVDPADESVFEPVMRL